MKTLFSIIASILFVIPLTVPLAKADSRVYPGYKQLFFTCDAVIDGSGKTYYLTVIHYENLDPKIFMDWRNRRNGQSPEEACRYTSAQLTKNFQAGVLLYLVTGTDKENKFNVICASETTTNREVVCDDEKILVVLAGENPKDYIKKMAIRAQPGMDDVGVMHHSSVCAATWEWCEFRRLFLSKPKVVSNPR
jgi:Circadian oscillating protein COP23